MSDRKQNNRERPSYSHGNSTWNTEQYKNSVRTERTTSRVLEPKKSSYYYDNTPAAQRARRKKELEAWRRRWQESRRKNRRNSRIKRNLTSFIIIAITLAILFTGVYKLLFVATDITVVGCESYTAEEVIAAAGLNRRVNLFSFSSRVAYEKMKFNCPRIAETDFDRTVPNKVTITVTEEKPFYYINIYGSDYALSKSLRMLDKISEEERNGLVRLRVSAVSKAVSGEKIVMGSERAERYLDGMIEVLEKSPLLERVTQIDLRNDFRAYMVVDDKYLLELGAHEDMDIKLRLAAETLKAPDFQSETRARIDLRDTTKTSVVFDNLLTFD